MATENHAVWTVYDKLRTACLNVKYYGKRLHALERQNFTMELLLAITSSSTIAGLWLWQSDDGKKLWLALGTVTAFLAVVKPLLNLTKKIKDFESVLAGYRLLEYDLRELKAAIEQKSAYDNDLKDSFKKIGDRERVLVEKTPETSEKAALKAECEAEVLQEYPTDRFFVPA